MQNTDSPMLTRVFTLMTGLLILKVSVDVVLSYRDYFPPNFESEFLRGREYYFSGVYQWVFYTHIVTGPVSLLLGLILVSERVRNWLPYWHRYLGRIQAVIVLFLVAPSGFWMAFYASPGAIATFGFATLGIVTGISVATGWQAAVTGRFAQHQRWMFRCFLLLSSTVVIRMIGGLTTVLDVQDEWIDSAAAWVSWLLPLFVFEVSRRTRSENQRCLDESVGATHRA